MKLSWPLGAARTASVAAVAAAACAMWAMPAGAATAAPSVFRFATKTVVSAPKTAYTHTNIKLSATVKGAGRTPGGTVTFWFGTRKLCHASLSRGTMSCEASFADPATKTVRAVYSGDAHHKGSSGTAAIKVINKPATGKFATTTTINNPPLNAPVTAQAGTEVALQATVTSAGGGVPTGTVEFLPTNLGPGPYATDIVCNIKLVNGTGKCDVDPPVGTWGFILYQATYLGDATHTGSATVAGAEYKLITPDPTATTVEGPATAAAGSVTITADVVPDTYGGPTYNILAGFSETGGDTVQFAVDGTTVCAASALQWNGTVNLATCADNLAAGSHTVVATYSGDEYTNGSTSESFTITVS
ncbi:MAG TPA: Ig-like domain-containing protein [Streptosporangiaceae bacterium]|nr:Ig-like domain-containing protein [Streptosporangiaceae bacterium]